MIADEKVVSARPRFEQATTKVSPDTSDLTITLPEAPLIKIRPTTSWAGIRLGEVWAHRELLLLLIWRELKLRYKQTVLGTSWVILQPLMMTLVFTVFIGLIGRPPMKNVPYPLFLYAGLLPWTFFSTAVLSSSYSLVSNADLVRKLYFPRVVLPVSAVGVRLSDFIISFAALLVLMSYYGARPSVSIIILPLIILNLVLFTVGIGTWFSALNIKYGDVGTVLPIVLQLWMFASPIIYPSHLVPKAWEWVYYLNPLAGIIEGFRAALFNLPLNWNGLAVSAVVTLLLLVYVSYSFRSMEEGWADII